MIYFSQLLLSQSASTVKRLCLELGGNAPFIVFKSADLDKAVQVQLFLFSLSDFYFSQGALASKFRCNGQTCVAANRFFVEKLISEEFTSKLAEQVNKLKCGNGLDKDVQVGPLINQRAIDKVNLRNQSIKEICNWETPFR